MIILKLTDYELHLIGKALEDKCFKEAQVALDLNLPNKLGTECQQLLQDIKQQVHTQINPNSSITQRFPKGRW